MTVEARLGYRTLLVLTASALLRVCPTIVALLLACLTAPFAASAQGGLRKGPWLMDLHSDTVVVLAERRSAGLLEVEARPADADAGGAVRVRSQGPHGLHELRLEGLIAGTRYRYVVRGPGVDPVEGRFVTAPADPQPFRFLIYGDTRSHPDTHRTVIEAMRTEGPDFVVHTGDLVEDGRDESDWQTFFDVEAPLLRETVFVPVIGNHEIVRPSSTGIENYRRYVHVAAGGPSPELDYVFRYGGARFVLANAYDDWTGPARDWLDQELTRARSEDPRGWLFVVMHWGPRSSGPHGDNPMLNDAGIDRMLRRHHVDLVISGHDHAYERGSDEGLRFMVTGGAGAPRYHRARNRTMTAVFAEAHHYVRVDVERDKCTFTALRPDGGSLDRAVLRHDGWEDMLRDASREPAPITARPLRTDPESADPTLVWKLLVAAVCVIALGGWLRRRSAPPVDPDR